MDDNLIVLGIAGVVGIVAIAGLVLQLSTPSAPSASRTTAMDASPQAPSDTTDANTAGQAYGLPGSNNPSPTLTLQKGDEEPAIDGKDTLFVTSYGWDNGTPYHGTEYLHWEVTSEGGLPASIEEKIVPQQGIQEGPLNAVDVHWREFDGQQSREATVTVTWGYTTDEMLKTYTDSVDVIVENDEWDPGY